MRDGMNIWDQCNSLLDVDESSHSEDIPNNSRLHLLSLRDPGGYMNGAVARITQPLNYQGMIVSGVMVRLNRFRRVTP